MTGLLAVVAVGFTVLMMLIEHLTARREDTSPPVAHPVQYGHSNTEDHEYEDLNHSSFTA